MKPAIINTSRLRISSLLPPEVLPRQTTRPLSSTTPPPRLRPFQPFQPLLPKRYSLRHHHMSEPSAKRVKMSDSPVIGTHNGHFHADEALAVYLLRLLPQYANSSLIRTRDADVLKTCDIVCDVGGVHDHDAKRYDHHQRDFNAVFPGSATKLSSAGLVWMHYGKHIIEAVTGLSTSEANNDLLYNKLYADFIEAFDANDNGIPVYDPAALRSAGIEKRFSEKGFSMAGVVNRFNYATAAPRDAAKASVSADAAAEPKQKSQDEEDSRFLKASHFVGEQFVSELLDKHSSWLPAREVVKQAFADRTQYDAQGRIIVIPHRPEGVPWMEHLYNLEEENNAKGAVLYALFAESGEADSKWRIRAVSLEPGSFENRKGLPEAWRGVRDEDLSKASGIPGSIFVHASGFIGGNATFEGALQMAKQGADL